MVLVNRPCCAPFQPSTALEGEIVISSTQPPSPITSLTDKQLSRLIGIVLTEKPDVQNMTIEELVGMGRSPYTGFWGTLDDEDKKIVGEAIQLVGIENLQGRMVHTLSDGERQKVMIAKALAQQTPIIYLDGCCADWLWRSRKPSSSPPMMWNYRCNWLIKSG